MQFTEDQIHEKAVQMFGVFSAAMNEQEDTYCVNFDYLDQRHKKSWFKLAEKELKINSAVYKDEFIDATSDSFPGFFVLSAISVRKDILQKIKQNPVNVTFLVNGMQLPYVDTMQDIYHRMKLDITNIAEKIAQDMVTSAGLEGLVQAMNEAESDIKEALLVAKRNIENVKHGTT